MSEKENQKTKYSVQFRKSAEKELNSLEDNDFEMIVDKLRILQENPRIYGVEKLSGRNEYKYKIGRFRVIFDIFDSTKIIDVLLIDDRKQVYKKLKRIK